MVGGTFWGVKGLMGFIDVKVVGKDGGDGKLL